MSNSLLCSIWYNISIKDITNQRDAQKLLNYHVKRFHTLIENLQEAYVSLDRDFRFLATNHYNSLLTGKTPNQLIGKKWEEVFPESVGSPFWITAKKALEEQTIQTLEAYFPPLKKWLLTTYYPTSEGIDTFAMDITVRKLQEQQKDSFLAMVAHELRTPLTSAKIYTEYLKQLLSKGKNKENITIISKVNTQISSLTELTQEILESESFLTGHLKLNKEKFYVQDLVEEVIEDVQLSTKEQLMVDWHTHLLVNADREKLRHVFINLLSNAIKFSPKGKKIIFKSRHVKDTILVSIQDFGIGIKKDMLDKIFDRYYQEEEKVTYPGLRLGLYISKEIITAEGGKMWAESNIGNGSTIYFSLPIYIQS